MNNTDGLIFNARGVVGVGRPLAEVDAVRAPFEASAAGQAAALLKIEAIEEALVVRPPGGGAEILIPIDLFARRFGLGGKPAAGGGAQAAGMGMHRVELAESTFAGEVDRVHEVGQAA